jgi:hypothetical protein
VFSTPDAGCSLGFHPSRVRTRGPRPGFRPISSHTLHRSPWLPRGKATTPTGAPECRSALALSCSPPRTLGREAKQATLRGFPHLHHPEHSSPRRPGYVFASHLVVHYCRPAGGLRTMRRTLPELPGLLEVPSIRVPIFGDLLNIGGAESLSSSFGSRAAQTRRSDREGLCFI